MSEKLMIPNTMRPISVTGNVMPMHLDGQPFLVQMPGIIAFFVVIFTSAEKLRDAMKTLGPGEEYKIKQVTDGKEFCQSLFEQNVRIMRDPYIVDGDKTHWTEIRG